MEFLGTTSFTTFQLSPLTSLFSPHLLNRTWTKKFPLAYSKFSGNPSFTPYLCLPRARNLQVSAHFVRPSSRRNSLRKKLIDDQQVRRNPTPQIPSSTPNIIAIDSEGLELNQSRVGEGFLVEASHGVLEPGYIGKSVLLNKLDNWVEQYKKDMEFWGIGSAPIFTVFQDSNENVKWVSVNQDEILKRSKTEDSADVNSKILHAESLAREMENGKNVIPKNSSVAKFIVQGGEPRVLSALQGLTFRPVSFAKLSRIGSMVICSFIVLWAVKKFLTSKNKEIEYTEMEKEMMRRKIKSRKEREMTEDGRVEVVEVRPESPLSSFEKPKLDKQEIINSITKAKAPSSSIQQEMNSVDFDCKIQEIKDMAREARKIEAMDQSIVEKDHKLPSDIESSQEHDDELGEVNGLFESPGLDFEGAGSSNSSNMEAPIDTISMDLEDFESKIQSTETGHSNIGGKTGDFNKPFTRMKPRVIKSVKEAREYLSEKRKKQEPVKEIRIKTMLESVDALRVRTGSEKLESSNASSSIQDGNSVEEQAYNGSFLNDKESILVKNGHSTDLVEEEALYVSSLEAKKDVLFPNGNSKESLEEPRVSGGKEVKPAYVKTENWIEENFYEVEPVVKKMGVGFRDNYMVAREKGSGELNTDSALPKLESSENDDELEWMNDENLREIVFQVRENELAGRDPFFAMDAEDRREFFEGLEKKVEVENQKMLKLHEWLHSNIENLDYGADGISVYDPPEKVIPRWKGPILEKSPAFYEEFLEQRRAIFGDKTGISNPVNKDKESLSRKSTEKISTSLETRDPKIIDQNRDTLNSKTIIKGSDGSVRAGKKKGKEFWQHTKKWSRGFLESYNAETDPEIKTVMRDVGKDLDRWITEKEIEEAADLMTKLPERNKQFMEKKLSKLKREMELFGPQAVVSKYSEYAEVKEEDHLWWLDLPHVLCIELYTVEDGDQRIGFYSLEMAADLELEPKPHHVIAFENVSDCKNLCYIIQSHMEMEGNGNAFVVARPPKEAFREAKANGFYVTVIRNGELRLSVDQKLEEVEEKITEIGSKSYHDEIMRERSVDISSLMKGVFGLSNKPSGPKRKRSKRKPKKNRRK